MGIREALPSVTALFVLKTGHGRSSIVDALDSCGSAMTRQDHEVEAFETLETCGFLRSPALDSLFKRHHGPSQGHCAWPRRRDRHVLCRQYALMDLGASYVLNARLKSASTGTAPPAG
ncbi:hypothetical protein ACRAWD_22815 [Caulobacter segnis]